ncbi:MAG: hypothetical protein PHH71_02895 [Clostridia bacterium]|jgi:hypothetical protein|nr:hypothetical protein [Clostridia bacterium]MDD3232120.1 hypothetical protein [Clostridia bacterium]MDD3862397.1 hypothetical protein [Clostridia bacterium]
MVKQKKIRKTSLIITGLLIFSVLLFAVCNTFISLAKNENEKIFAYSPFKTSQTSLNYNGGDGSKSNPYQIETVSALRAMRNEVNNGKTYGSSYFILTSNLNLKDEGYWTPIGVFGKLFCGVFDGNGYTISNVTLQKDFIYNGVFGNIRNAKIMNLQLKEITLTGFTSNTTYVGGLVGKVDGDSEISHVSITNSNLSLKKSTSNNSFALGGLVGASTGTRLTIKNCVSQSVSISTAKSDNYLHYTGGLIGFAERVYVSSTNSYIPTVISNSYSIGNELIDFKLIQTFQSGDTQKDNIIVTNSYADINQRSLFFGPHGNNNFDKVWDKEQLFQSLNNQWHPNTWIKYGNQVVLKGVDNVFFELDNSENIRIQSDMNYPYQKNYDRKITLTGINDRVVMDIKIHQSIYLNTYDNSNFTTLKQEANFGYYEKKSNYNVYLSFNISNVFGNIEDRQGFFTISPTLLLTKIDMPVVQKYYDITTNTWQITDGGNITNVMRASVINYDFIDKIIRQNDYLNHTYISEITEKRYEFSKAGTVAITITTPNFKITPEHLNLIADGYTLNVLYTNGFMFQTKADALTINNYWLSGKENPAVYTKNGMQFTSISLGAGSSLIMPSSGSFAFVGWSAVEQTEPLDFYGREIDDKYVPWKSDFTTQLIVERGNLTELNQNYEATGISVGTFENWDFKGFTPTKKLVLYPVWGGDTIRLYTYVFSHFNDKYVLKTNYYVGVSDAVSVSNFYRLNKNRDYLLTLRNKDGSLFDINNKGFVNINWRVAEINEENKLEDLIGIGFGSFSQDSQTTNTLFSEANRQTTVVVVLEPKTDIGIILKVGNLEFDNNLSFKVNDEDYVENETKLVYGEPYVITISNIPQGYHLSNVEITNGCITEIKFNSRTGTCSFTVDFLDDIELTFAFAEGLFKELLLCIILAIGIALFLIAIFLVATKDVRKKNPEFEKGLGFEGDNGGGNDGGNSGNSGKRKYPDMQWVTKNS